ncbi:hypothetical protein K9M79_04020 [Candidatus Woesearchaeota archaeon]|nr:hypothetical protein [Candidatus Woesearchaeota archaeon]
MISILIIIVALIMLVQVMNNNKTNFQLPERAFESFHSINDNNFKLNDEDFLSFSAENSVLYLTDPHNRIISVNGTAIMGGDTSECTDINLKKIVCFYGLDDCPDLDFGIYQQFHINQFASFNSDDVSLIIFSDTNISDVNSFRANLSRFKVSYVFLGRIFDVDDELFNVSIYYRSSLQNATFDYEDELISLPLESEIEQSAIYYDCNGTVFSHYSDGKDASCLIESSDYRALFFPVEPDRLIFRELLNNHVNFMLPNNIGDDAVQFSDYFIHNNEIVKAHVVRW